MASVFLSDFKLQLHNSFQYLDWLTQRASSKLNFQLSFAMIMETEILSGEVKEEAEIWNLMQSVGTAEPLAVKTRNPFRGA